ncbi:hypothetical protein NKH18_49040 [Streptomyces sp. M10(2022)]
MLNLVAESRIVNLKVMHTRVLTMFIARARPSLDPQFLEDLENYASMQLLYDPEGALASRLDQLRDAFVTTAPEWLTRSSPAATALCTGAASTKGCSGRRRRHGAS